MFKRFRMRDSRSSLIDPEFATAFAQEAAQRREGRERHMEHKTRQLCRQVQRALNVVLGCQLAVGTLEGVFVSAVSPAAGCGHLIVYLLLPDGSRANDVLREIRAHAPRLRAEVARSISRKRAPELSFVPAAAQVAQHE